MDDDPDNITGAFLAGVEQRLADLTDQQFAALAAAVFHQDNTDPKAQALDALRGYVGQHTHTANTADTDASTPATGIADLKSGTTGTPNQLTQPTRKDAAADALRRYRQG